MRRLKLPLFLLLLLCVFGVFPLAAQGTDLDQGIPMEASTIWVPENWSVTAETVVGGWVAADGGLSVHILEPVLVDRLIDVTTATTAADVVDEMEDVLNLGASRADIRFYDGLRYRAAIYTYHKEPDGGALIGVEVGDEAFLALHVQSEGRAVEKSLGFVNLIIGTYSPGSVGVMASSDGRFTTGASETDAEATETAVVSAASGEACQVVSADGATLRVGPGLNRSSIAFLTTTTPVTVSGRFVGDDDAVWYQLDKAQAAPQSAANELWVLAEEVETTGDCDTIGEVAAPPIIRATNPQPPAPAQPVAPPAETGADTTAVEPAAQPTAVPAQPQQPAAPGDFPVPQAGNWMLTLSGETNMSCQGTDNLVVPSSEIWEELSFVGSLSATRDGSSLNIDGDTFVFAPPDQYVGSYTYDDGSNMQLYLTLQSPTLMTGRATINLVVDNLPCSATVGVTISRV